MGQISHCEIGHRDLENVYFSMDRVKLKKSLVFIIMARIALISLKITSQEESNEPNNSRLNVI